MGDDITDDWDGKVNIDPTFEADAEDDASEVGEESDSELEQEIESADAKKKRKKQKFEELKKQIKMRKLNNNDAASPTESNVPNFFSTLKVDSPLHKLLSKEDFHHFDATETSPTIVSSIPQILPRFKKMIKSRGDIDEIRGCPLILIIALSAIRATDIVKSISKAYKCKIAKLFAKHIKIQQQIEDLNQHIYPIAIGTPSRISKLIELGALHLSKTRGCIIDSYKDKKEFSITTLPGVSDEFTILIEKHVQSELDHLKLVYV